MTTNNYEIDGRRVDNPNENQDGRSYGQQHVQAAGHTALRPLVLMAPDISDYVDSLSGRWQVPFGD